MRVVALLFSRKQCRVLGPIFIFFIPRCKCSLKCHVMADRNRETNEPVYQKQSCHERVSRSVEQSWPRELCYPFQGFSHPTSVMSGWPLFVYGAMLSRGVLGNYLFKKISECENPYVYAVVTKYITMHRLRGWWRLSC